ncbi:MAG: hypothetical protein ABJN26_15895 [Stappiaceae bacterium]
MMHENGSDTWLSDVAILNENFRFSEAGDVAVYRNIADMCEKLEHWFVEENHGFALTGNGLPIELSTDGERVFGKVSEQKKPEPAILKGWLISAAAALRDARIYQADKRGLKLFGSTNIGLAERSGILPETVEGLIAYLGMDR